MRFLVPLVERREETRVEVGESLSREREIIGSAYVIVDRTKEEERKGLMSHVMLSKTHKRKHALRYRKQEESFHPTSIAVLSAHADASVNIYSDIL